jgi:ribose/xylose/arabinose/galactoside ABC-type transport system permease subunit
MLDRKNAIHSLHLAAPLASTMVLPQTVYFGVAMMCGGRNEDAARISAVGLGGVRIFRVVRSPSDD